MIPFKINGQKHLIPTVWSDVTYHQYIKLITTPNNLIDYIAVFVDIPRETLATAKLNNVERIALALSFLTIPPKFEAKPAKMVGPYYVPKDITLESLGQFEDLRALITQMPSGTTPEECIQTSELYLSSCSIYIQKIADGKYDPQRVEAVKDKLRNYSCVEVIQTGSFFFYKLLNTSQGITHRSQSILPRLKKLLLGFPGFQKSLDSLQRSLKPQNK